jgi:cobalt-zinc-cadmium efflux system protein
VHAHEHHGAGHSHAHHDQPQHGGTLLAALLLTFAFSGVEALAGWWAGSLALLADAIHMLTDGSSLALAAAAAWLARRPPSLRHSYGFARAEVLAALINSVLMLVLLGFIVHEAIGRIGTPRAIHGDTVVGVAVIGLMVNLAVAWLLSRGAQTLNSRAALLHVLGDALGSVAAIVAGLVILITGWTPIDPLLSMLVAALILVSALRLVREAVHVLMEGVPFDLQLDTIGRELAALDGVLRVHDLHVWTLASGSVALSAHMEVRTLDDWPRILAEARELLDAHHGIHHVTLQPEVLMAQPLVQHVRAPS